jgi:hypothetical protein
MRGNPLLRIALVCLGVLLMGYPVLRLTQARTAVQAAPAPAAASRNLEISVSFAHAPESFALTCLGRPVLSGRGPATAFSGTWTSAVPKEGLDLLLQVEWPRDTLPTAVRVRVEAGGATLADKTWWGRGRLTELVTVSPP